MKAEQARKKRKAEQARQQRMDALNRANEIRYYRAELKRKIRSGEITVVQLGDILIKPPPQLHAMRARDLLKAVPKIGDKKASIFLRRLCLSYNIQLGRISENHREILAEMISNWEQRMLESHATDQEGA